MREHRALTAGRFECFSEIRARALAQHGGQRRAGIEGCQFAVRRRHVLGRACKQRPHLFTRKVPLSRKQQRHDAFTDTRKRAFLKALMKTGCVLDACRATGVSAKTVYRHQESDPAFAEYCRIAQAMSVVPLELVAWRRAIEGVEREFACGGQVHVRRIYSDSLLRLLLQASNPKKYGANPGFTRKRLAKAERKAIRRESMS